MPRVPRSVVVERKKRAWELTQQGWSEKRIALELGISVRTVRRYLTALARKAETELDEKVLRVKHKQLAQLEHTVDQAFQAWEISKRPEQIVSKKTIPGEVVDEETGQRSPPQEIVTTRVRGQAGDPRFLREAREAMADIRNLLGIKPEEEQLLTMDDVQRLFDELPATAQTAYLRFLEVIVEGSEGASEDEPERITSRSGQTYFT
jgi:predicted transcriptional regulator